MTLPRIQHHVFNLQKPQRSTGDPRALGCALQHWHQCTDGPDLPPGCLVSPTGWGSHAISKIAHLWLKYFGIQTHLAIPSCGLQPASAGRRPLFVRKKPFPRTSVTMFTASRQLFALVLALSSSWNASCPWEDIISFSLNLDEKTIFSASTYFAGPNCLLLLAQRQALCLAPRKMPGNACLVAFQFELMSLDISNKTIVLYSSILYNGTHLFSIWNTCPDTALFFSLLHHVGRSSYVQCWAPGL